MIKKTAKNWPNKRCTAADGCVRWTAVCALCKLVGQVAGYDIGGYARNRVVDEDRGRPANRSSGKDRAAIRRLVLDKFGPAIIGVETLGQELGVGG